MVKSKRTKTFKALFALLPKQMQQSATNRYREYFSRDPFHPLLRRHDLHDVRDAQKQSFAVEMHYGYRAVAFQDPTDSCYVWYWCGSHADYDERFRSGR